jgi:DNA-binding response OmpR family regulator
MKVGILEDDLTQIEIYKTWLKTEEHEVTGYRYATAFKEAVITQDFDLLIIDMVLPKSNGLQVLEWVRATKGWELPIIFATSIDSEIDIVKTLRAGADDYVVKPAKFSEFIARIESISRRNRYPIIQSIGAYEIDKKLRQIKNGKQVIELTQKEFELASYFFQNSGKLLSRKHLLDKLWGLNSQVDTRTLDTHVSKIRRKLNIRVENGLQILPVYGYGYRSEISKSFDLFKN